MPNKTARKELSSETIAVILTLHKLGYSASRIRDEEGLTKNVPKSTITFQIRRAKKHQNDPFVKAIRTGRPPKLDARAERRLVRYVARNPFETITCMPHLENRVARCMSTLHASTSQMQSHSMTSLWRNMGTRCGSKMGLSIIHHS